MVVASRTLASSLFLLFSLELPALAADDADALFQRGVSEMKSGRYDEACPLIEQSYRLDPKLGALFNLAECELNRGRSAAAISRYEEYLRRYESLSPAARQNQVGRPERAREQSGKLRPQLAELTVVLAAGSPPGATVERNGAEVAASELGAATLLEPGDYLLTARASGAGAAEVRVSLGKGDRKTVLLDLKTSSAPARSAAPTGMTGRRIAAFTTAGAGIAGLVVSAIAGFIALSSKGPLQDNCGLGGLPQRCNTVGLSAANKVQSFGLVSTIGFAVGGVGITTGVILFAMEPRPPSAAHGELRWLGAGLLSAGPSGASAGVRGAW